MEQQPERTGITPIAEEVRQMLVTLLDLPYTHLLSDADLSRICLTAFCDNREVEVRVRDQKRYIESRFPFSKQDQRRYRNLIGGTEYATGNAVKGLQRIIATNSLPPGSLETAAELVAQVVHTNPREIPHQPGVRFLAPQGVLGAPGIPSFHIGRPITTVIEYGPGAAGFGRFPTEVAGLTQLTLIDRNRFIAHFLTHYASLQGVRFPTVWARDEGITAVTQEMLAGGMSVDVVIASMIQSAGERDFQVGIENAYQLLKPEGVLALFSPHPTIGRLNTRRQVEIARDIFNDNPEKQYSYRSIPNNAGTSSELTHSFFRKKV